MQSAHMMRDHGHSSNETAQRLSSGAENAHLKDMIYGEIDGAVTTFAIVADVEGAGFSHNIIVALGIANTGAVRRMRTSLSMTLNAGTYAEQSWRHSARAAARFSLKLARE